MSLPYENLQEGRDVWQNCSLTIRSSTVFGVAVIGTGVVGCAIARMLSLHGFGVVILEKNNNVIGEASAGKGQNSLDIMMIARFCYLFKRFTGHRKLGHLSLRL